MHFAAQTHVGLSTLPKSVLHLMFLLDNSFGNSFEFTRSNVNGTHVLLESAKLFHPQVSSIQNPFLFILSCLDSPVHSREYR